MTVLYADDDPDDYDILREALKEIDPSISCHFANNGIEVLKILKGSQQLPDYILLDLNMPLMNGKKCLSELKANPKFKSIPVIIYSTTIHREERYELCKLGANSILEKPTNIPQLQSVLVELLNLTNCSK